MISALKYLKGPALRRKISLDIKHFTRTVTGDRLKPLNQDTLTGRFLLYLENNRLCKDSSNIDKLDLISTLRSRPIDIQKFDTNCVITAINSLNDKGTIHDRDEFWKLLHIIDAECCKRLKTMNVDITINLLHSFMNAFPHRVTECHYFHLALEDLMNQRHRLNKDELIHLIFFIGLLKKSKGAQHMLRTCLKLFDNEYVDSLTKEDLCILCNSTFKTSTRIKNYLLLEHIKFYINNNLLLLNDPGIFITLIKTLRHNRYQDEDILATITCTIFFNQTFQCYSFAAMCHILALYADHLYYDKNILDVFSKTCLEKLKNSTYQSKDAYLEEQPRTKDIKRFLWSLSNLNYKLSKSDIETIIIPQILIRIQAGEFKNDPGTLVDIILYLWMMQYKAYTLINNGITADIVQFIRANNVPSQKSLNLLLTCIYYEDINLFNSLNIQPEKVTNYNLNIQLQKRPVLKKIVENLKQVSVENEIDKYDVGCQVPYINIIGITGFQKKIYKIINIEVMDDYTCLKNTDALPTGLMGLKLRILDQSDEGLVVVNASDIASCSDTELQEILQDEVSLVC